MQNHGITDVGHEEFVQHQQATPGSDAFGQHRQGVGGIRHGRELPVDVVHETVEMPALERNSGQSGNEQLGHQGFSAADRTPEVKAFDRFRFSETDPEQAAARAKAKCRSHGVEQGNYRALGRVILDQSGIGLLPVYLRGQKVHDGTELACRNAFNCSRKGSNLPWKKWPVSGIITISGSGVCAFSHCRTLSASTISSASP